MNGLNGKIDAILDGGPCPVGLESTIVGGDPLCLLRPGGITAEAIAGCLGEPLQAVTPMEKPNAPGQLSSHYAPNAKLRLNARTAHPDEVFLGFGPDCEAHLNLSSKADLTEAAANLFSMLRDIDDLAAQKGAPCIAVSPIPDEGLGVAINDRLRRAAAPRT